MRPIVAILVLLVLGGTSSTAFAAAAEDRRAVAAAARWLERQPLTLPAGQQADLIVALRVAGTPPSQLNTRLRALAEQGPAYAGNPGQAAKVARAAMAAGANPRRFGGVDYIDRVTRGYARGRYGRDAFSHSLAILALSQAGEQIPTRAVTELRRTRGSGGWNFQLRTASSDQVDTTALVIQAMRVAGVTRSDPALRGSLAWLRKQRNRRGGYDSGGQRGSTEANSTAAAILALKAMGYQTARERRELRTLQQRNGAFLWRSSTPGSALLATLDGLYSLAR